MITVYEGKTKHELQFIEGKTILELLQMAGIQSITAPCGGKGVCKKCRVFVHSEAYTGVCLSCTTPATDNMIVELIPEVRISFADSSEAPVYPPTPGQTGYGVACDLGTTIVICQLVDLSTGKLLAKVSGSNSQRIFGSDVLSRLKAAEEGHFEEISGLIVQQLNYYIKELCRETKIDIAEIKMLSIAANTIMLHFVAGLNPAQISTAPFVPVSLFGCMEDSHKLGFDFDGQVYLAPAVSPFIGSDVVGGILTTRIAKSDAVQLMIDLGTNTEMIIGNKNGMIGCTVDGGVALKASLLEHGMSASEGAICGITYDNGQLLMEVLGAGKPKGICGSGFIDLLAFMYEKELLDEVGHIVDADEADEEFAKYLGEEDGKNVFYLTEDKAIFISQTDISKFQLAKAAIFAGIQILSEEQQISYEDIEHLYMGGGFGTFVQVKSAALLGLIPYECRGKSSKVGNIALAGAISALLSEDARSEMERLQKCVRVVDLPTHPSFSDVYTEGMFFE